MLAKNHFSQCFRVLFQSNMYEPLFVYTWNDVRELTNHTLFSPKTNGECKTTRYLHPTWMTNEKPFVILTPYGWRMVYYLFYISFILYNYQIIYKSRYFFSFKIFSLQSFWRRLIHTPTHTYTFAHARPATHLDAI